MNANLATGYCDRGQAIVVYFVPTVRSRVLLSSNKPVIARSFFDWENTKHGYQDGDLNWNSL